MASLSKKRIFIIEDNTMYSYFLEHLLNQNEEYIINSFSSGEECIEMLVNKPDVILLDYNLGKQLNGMETLQIIKAKKPKTKVIVLTAQKDVQLAADLLQEGAFDYIRKSGEQKEVMERLRSSILHALSV